MAKSIKLPKSLAPKPFPKRKKKMSLELMPKQDDIVTYNKPEKGSIINAAWNM